MADKLTGLHGYDLPIYCGASEMGTVRACKVACKSWARWWQVCSLSWNTVHRTQFLSASWDDTAKLWDSEQPQSLRTFGEHTYCVYAAIW